MSVRNEPASFVAMSPRWRLPLRAAPRMAAAQPPPDPDRSLARLRDMQRAILSRRSRMPQPPTDDPAHDARSLASALFPNVPHATSPSEHSDAPPPPEQQLPREAVSPHGTVRDGDRHSDVALHRMQMQGRGVSSASTGTDAMQQGDAAGASAASGAGSAGSSGDGPPDNQDAWRLAMSRRRKASSTEYRPTLRSPNEGLRSSGEGTARQSNVSRASAVAGAGSSGEDGDGPPDEESLWRIAMSERPRESLSESRAVPKASGPMVATGGHVPAGVGSDISEKKTAVARNVTRRREPFSKTEGKQRVLSPITVWRSSCSLPWKDLEKRRDAEELSPALESFELPLLSIFISNANWPRADWRLPRAVYAHARTKRASDKQTQSTDCSSILAGLNMQQRNAVLADRDKACLVLAGPGSGKTRVLTHRIAYLVKRYNVSPRRILAVTFTNKAAEEMKDRVSQLLETKFAPDWAPDGDGRLAMGTFHSISARFLRKHGSEIGIPPEFAICDSSDSRQVVKKLLKRVEGVTPESSAVGEMTAMVSKLKNDRDNALQEALPDSIFKKLVDIRALYDEELRSMKQLDFDDLLLETRNLLERSSTVLGLLQDTYDHVLVDEWQDTNHVQFDIVSLLSGKSRNLFVVGDADQSIYKFRGADSGNLERFSETFSNATQINLEQNYRSSACIVAAAQCVIEGNVNRPSKQMTTSNEFGSKILVRETMDDRQEAQFVVSTLRKLMTESMVGSFSDVAIMYRTNAQSRLLEEACMFGEIPYRLLSGTKFYDRQEIRDLVAYLRLLSNPADDNAFRRIVNTPPRGIGKKTVEALEAYSESQRIPLLLGLDKLLETYVSEENLILGVDLRKSSMKKLLDFHWMLTTLRRNAEPFLAETAERDPKDDGVSQRGVDSLLIEVLKLTGYREYLEKVGENVGRADVLEKTIERLGNVDELVRASSTYSNLYKYLESVTLMVATSKQNHGEDNEDKTHRPAVSLMTLHGGKGLEFSAVFIVGAEDNMIPCRRTEGVDLEEERRLLYVGMTRAKRHLYITWRAKKLVIQGNKTFKRDGAGPSRFLDDMSDELVDRVELEPASSRSKTQPRKTATPGRKTWTNSKTGGTMHKQMAEWRVGDSVRCGVHGRGTVTTGAPASSDGAWIEVLFANGSKHFVNTLAQDVRLLFSPSS